MNRSIFRKVHIIHSAQIHTHSGLLSSNMLCPKIFLEERRVILIHRLFFFFLWCPFRSLGLFPNDIARPPMKKPTNSRLNIKTGQKRLLLFAQRDLLIYFLLSAFFASARYCYCSSYLSHVESFFARRKFPVFAQREHCLHTHPLLCYLLVTCGNVVVMQWKRSCDKQWTIDKNEKIEELFLRKTHIH